MGLVTTMTKFPSKFQEALKHLQGILANNITRDFGLDKVDAQFQAEAMTQGISRGAREDQEALLSLYTFLVGVRQDVSGQLGDAITKVLTNPQPLVLKIVQNVMDAGAIQELRRTAAKIDREHDTFSDERGVSPELGQRLNVTALRLYRRAMKIEKGEAHAGSE